jgi:hypothetical protein
MDVTRLQTPPLAIPITMTTVSISRIRTELAAAAQYKLTPTNFNTKDIPLAVMTTALPRIPHYTPTHASPWLLLSPWLPLILKSQNRHPATVHTIRLPRLYCAGLTRIGTSAVQSRFINESDAEDLSLSFPRRTNGKCPIPIESLFGSEIETSPEAGIPSVNPPRYFIRLDPCSLKDACTLPYRDAHHSLADRGLLPVTNPKQLWSRLVTSARALAALDTMLVEEDEVLLYLFPWDDDMGAQWKYRVFCPPAFKEMAFDDNAAASHSKGLPRVAAISQYRWREPWYLDAEHQAGGQKVLEREARRVIKAAERILEEILEKASAVMVAQGFSFDVCVKGGRADGEVVLVELNNFGGLTGTGSRLFEWVRDAKVLYGLEEGVEFRVAVEMWEGEGGMSAGGGMVHQYSYRLPRNG